MLRIAAPQLLPHLGVGAGPEAAEVAWSSARAVRSAPAVRAPACCRGPRRGVSASPNNSCSFTAAHDRPVLTIVEPRGPAAWHGQRRRRGGVERASASHGRCAAMSRSWMERAEAAAVSAASTSRRPRRRIAPRTQQFLASSSGPRARRPRATRPFNRVRGDGLLGHDDRAVARHRKRLHGARVVEPMLVARAVGVSQSDSTREADPPSASACPGRPTRHIDSATSHSPSATADSARHRRAASRRQHHPRSGRSRGVAPRGRGSRRTAHGGDASRRCGLEPLAENISAACDGLAPTACAAARRPVVDQRPTDRSVVAPLAAAGNGSPRAARRRPPPQAPPAAISTHARRGCSGSRRS